MNQLKPIIIVLLMLTFALAGCSGIDGAEGIPGPQGETGEQGPPGIQGEMGAAGTNGQNGTNGMNGTAGDQGPPGAKGEIGPAGNDGRDGVNSLISTFAEPPSENCLGGGTKIEVGTDTDGDGQLSPSEVDQSQYICNGVYSNTTMLTSISLPSESLECDTGSKVISVGLDNGQGGGYSANGIIEPGEIDSSITICNKRALSMIKNIDPGNSPGDYRIITEWDRDWGPAGLGSELFFQSSDAIHGTELWKTDGTLEGTMMVKDINPGTSGSVSVGSEMTFLGDAVYFWASEGATAFGSLVKELWKTDGTPEGTVKVRDPFSNAISTGSCSSEELSVWNGSIYFSGWNSTEQYDGCELWKTDGTTEGTMIIKSGGENFDPSSYMEVNGSLMFQEGGYLWKSDGTENGTQEIYGYFGHLCFQCGVVYNGEAFFPAEEHWSGTGTELWKSDGTTEGTMLVKDLAPEETWYGKSGNPNFLTVYDGYLYFSATDTSYNSWNGHGDTLWKSDGTENGTVRFFEDVFVPFEWNQRYPQDLVVIDNLLYLTMVGEETDERGLYVTNGTTNGTVLIMQDVDYAAYGLWTDPIRFSTPFEYSGLAYFTVRTEGYGLELWSTDGTVSGTSLVLDANYGPSDGVWMAYSFNSQIYLIADNGEHGLEYWTEKTYTDVYYT